MTPSAAKDESLYDLDHYLHPLPKYPHIMTRNENATSIETTVQNCLNICTNISNYLISLGKMMYPISDHLPTFINISNWRFRTLQQLWSQHQPQMSQSWSTTIVAIFKQKYCVFIVDFVQNYGIQYNFQQRLLHFSQLNYDKLWNTVAHHKTILQLLQFWYWNCDNCEIFKTIAVTYE